MTSSTPPPRPPRRDRPPLGGDSIKGFSEDFKRKLSGHIEKQAKKISEEGKILGGTDSESYELELKEEFEKRGIPIAQSPMPTGESERESKVDKGRKNFLSRMLKGIRSLARSVKDSRGVVAVGNFFSSIGTKRIEEAPSTTTTGSLGEVQDKKLELSAAKDAVVGLVDVLEGSGAIREEGLFRTGGRADSIKGFMAKLKDGTLELPHPKDPEVYIPDVAGELKAVIREMELFGSVKEQYLEVGGMGGTLKNDADKIQALRDLLDQIDPEAKEILKILITYLAKVAENSGENQMTTSNLATCFGPNLYKMELADAVNIPHANGAFKFMIENADKIFEG